MAKWGTRKRGRHAFPTRGPSVGVLFSGLLIAICFIAMVVPLALFHAAQVTATSRLRNAMVLVITVVAVLLSLGLLGHQPALIMGGIVGIFWIPIFAISLYLRMHHKSRFISAILLCLPVFLLFWTAWSIPPSFNLSHYLRELAAPLNAGPTPNPAAFKEWDSLINSLESSNGPFTDVAQFSKLAFWQRLSWLVYDNGSSWLLSALGVGLANLLLLDFAFEQIEKVRAIARYVKENSNRFSQSLVEALSAVLAHREPHRRRRPRKTSESEVRVVRSTPLPTDEEKPLWTSFFRGTPHSNTTVVMGHRFELAFSSSAWNLRHYALPFWLVALALGFLGYMALTQGAPSEIVLATVGQKAPVIAVGGVLAFIVLSVTAVQGVVVLLERLTPAFLLFVAVCAFVAFSVFPMGAHMILGIFGILGVIDYAYDLRGHLANQHKAV
jgi:hypothetical protein